MTVFLPNWAEFAQAVSPLLMVLLILMALDLLLGLIVALKQGVFDLAKVADFVLSNLAKIVFWLAWTFIEALLQASGALEGLPEAALQYSGTAIFIGLVIAFLGSIAGHGAVLNVPGVARVPGVRATGGAVDRAG